MSENGAIVVSGVSETKKARDLVEILSKMSQTSKEIDVDAIQTLDEVNDLVNQLSDTQTLNKIMDKIFNGTISGNADEYHNLSISFSRNNKPSYAMYVCKAGLAIWKNNVDLNADAIRYALDAGRINDAKKFVNDFIGNCQDRSKWNWRGFSFLLEYYQDVMPEGYKALIEELIGDYKKYLPYEEKAYVAEAQFQIKEGLQDVAIKTLEHAVNNLCAPQSSIMLADIYMEQGKYSDVIRVASLGIAYSAEVQPSIRTAYLIMLRALAKDAMYLREAYSSSNYSVTQAKQIISEYKLAEKYVSSRERENIQLRISILETFAGIQTNSGKN